MEYTCNYKENRLKTKSQAFTERNAHEKTAKLPHSITQLISYAVQHNDLSPAFRFPY